MFLYDSQDPQPSGLSFNGFSTLMPPIPIFPPHLSPIVPGWAGFGGSKGGNPRGAGNASPKVETLASSLPGSFLTPLRIWAFDGIALTVEMSGGR